MKIAIALLLLASCALCHNYRFLQQEMNVTNATAGNMTEGMPFMTEPHKNLTLLVHELGGKKFLVDANNFSLYVNEKDKESNFTCEGECLKKWLPLIVQDEKPEFFLTGIDKS